MFRPSRLMFAAAIFGIDAVGQAPSPPRFEVASVHLIPVAQTSVPGMVRLSVEAHPGSLTMRNGRLWTLVKWAYDLNDYQISGVDRLAAEHYNIEGRANPETPISELRIMLRDLLATRFKLAVHREARDVRGYDLVVAKGGARIHPTVGEEASDIDSRGTALILTNLTIAAFADWLSGPMHAPVVDRSKLEGKFTFTVDVPPNQSSETKNDQMYEFLAAMEKQTGLKLQTAKISVDYLIVDHFEKVPAEN